MTLLLDIERACHRHSIAPSNFRRDAVGDPRLIGDLRRGREPGRLVQARVRAFISRLDHGDATMPFSGPSKADLERLRELARSCSPEELQEEVDRARDALHETQVACESARIRLNLLVEACCGVPAGGIAK